MIRPARSEDEDAIWAILKPILREGTTYTLPRDMTRSDALAFWMGGTHDCFVHTDDDCDGQVLGTYYLCPNQRGGGAHVANCGFATAAEAQGQGIARAMLTHSLDTARARGFRAMQYNFVVSTNTRAITTWQRAGFDIIGTLPEAFAHPDLGFVDALLMYRKL